MAAVVTLQLGQCGNQLGQTFFSTLQDEIRSHPHALQPALTQQFFSLRGEDALPTARAVLIDMEPKVVSNCEALARSSGRWVYDPQGKFTRQSGSGNNWANGYAVHGPAVQEEVYDLIRKEVEPCDYLGGFQVLQSVAGGTGSGLGTYITEHLRDFYSNTFLLNHVIWPYSSGEVIVQSYNSLLTMAKLMEVSDGVVIVDNDVISNICSKLLNMARPSFIEMNQVIAQQMNSFLLPSFRAETFLHLIPRKTLANDPSQRTSAGQGPLDCLMTSSPTSVPMQQDKILVVFTLWPLYAYKIITVRSIPQIPKASKDFSSHSWPGLLKHLYQMNLSNSWLEEGIDWSVRPPEQSSPLRNDRDYVRSVSSLLFLRGPASDQADFKAFEDSRLYSPWALDPFSCYRSPVAFNGYDKHASLLSNNGGISSPLERLLASADEMFTARAYLHQYHAYGLEDDDFMTAFVRLEQVLKDYRAL